MKDKDLGDVRETVMCALQHHAHHCDELVDDLLAVIKKHADKGFTPAPMGIVLYQVARTHVLYGAHLDDTLAFARYTKRSITRTLADVSQHWPPPSRWLM